MEKKKNDRRMKERKGPKSYWQDAAAPDLSESRQQVGRLSRLRSTAWAAADQRGFYLVPALNERLRDHEGHVIQRCGEKAKFQDDWLSILGASRETQRYLNSYQPPRWEMKGFFLCCCFFFFFSNSPLRWSTSALSSSPALQAASSLITLDYSRLRLV